MTEQAMDRTRFDGRRCDAIEAREKRGRAANMCEMGLGGSSGGARDL